MPDNSTSSETIKFESTDGVELSGLLVSPITATRVNRAAVILHGFPSKDNMADYVTASLPELGERIAAQMLSHSLVLDFRGCGDSAGNFSLEGWVNDAKSACQYMLDEHDVSQLWICGFGTGGSVGLVAAEQIESVAGVATLGSPADFDDWSSDPDQLLKYAREIGAIDNEEFPEDLEQWRSELRNVRAIAAADGFSPRALLVMHGSEDVTVPHFDARLIADSHGEADLRFISGGGHQLKLDPRAVAVLLGWLSRQQVINSAESYVV